MSWYSRIESDPGTFTCLSEYGSKKMCRELKFPSNHFNFEEWLLFFSLKYFPTPQWGDFASKSIHHFRSKIWIMSDLHDFLKEISEKVHCRRPGRSQKKNGPVLSLGAGPSRQPFDGSPFLALSRHVGADGQIDACRFLVAC